MYVCARFIFCVEGADRLANAKDKQAPHVSPQSCDRTNVCGSKRFDDHVGETRRARWGCHSFEWPSLGPTGMMDGTTRHVKRSSLRVPLLYHSIAR